MSKTNAPRSSVDNFISNYQIYSFTSFFLILLHIDTVNTYVQIYIMYKISNGTVVVLRSHRSGFTVRVTGLVFEVGGIIKLARLVDGEIKGRAVEPRSQHQGLPREEDGDTPLISLSVLRGRKLNAPRITLRRVWNNPAQRAESYPLVLTRLSSTRASEE